jgi:GT2 family glycosyltransferase
MKISVVIPTRDRGAIFDKTLAAAVDALQGLNAEILVVNDSTKGVPHVPPTYPNTRLLSNKGRGVAAARNLGAREATGDLLLFLDDDIVINPDGIRHIVRLHESPAALAINPDWSYPPELMDVLHHSAFGRFLEAHHMTSFEGWYDDATWQNRAFFESKSVASFHLSMRKEDFDRTSGYDEKFPYAGFEDYDFPRRLRATGVSFHIDTRVRVLHNEADRLNLGNWLNSQERRAFTRAIAVRQGYDHLVLMYPPIKQLALQLILFSYPLWLALLSHWPNGKRLDKLAFAGIGYLQAAKIYKGYSRGMKS